MESTVIQRINKSLIIVICILFSVCLGACDKKQQDADATNTANNTPIEVEKDINNPNISIEIVREPKDEDEASEDDVLEEQEDEGDVAFDSGNAYSYVDKPLCKYNKSDKCIDFTFDFINGIPQSDDNLVYLFEIQTFESEENFHNRDFIASSKKQESMSLNTSYKERYLFSRFVPALLVNGEYVAISHGKYITNPNELALCTKAYPKVKSKKGMLVDTTTIGTDMLTSLNPSRVIYNIPLSYIMGETEDAANPTISYEYNGETYHFNGHRCMLFDSLFTNLTNKGYHCTAIILNDWNSKYPDMVHPLSRNKTSSSLYYAFNTEEERGVRLMEAAALFLAERYSTGEHGMVYDWVIANEMNQHTMWNYMDTSDVDYYTESFERSFRIFYNAIKSRYSNANVYFSIDHDWNDNGGKNNRFFNGRDVLYSFNKYARMRGNYDWGLAIHPYPDPLPKVKFWEGSFDKSENAEVLTPMNLSTLTSVMKKDEFLDSSGRVRQIAVTELGFSSTSGEKLQAAAYAYCYYIIANNKYINSFLLNRQTDSPEEMQQGLALGIYNLNHTPKYLANVFARIDSEGSDDFLQEMLGTIGASSLEEALSWAN